MCRLGPLSTYVTELSNQGHIKNQMSTISYMIFIARVRSEISFKCTQYSVSLTQQVQKKLFCLGISGFKLSLESCSPLPISLTVLHVACCVENKCTHFFMFIAFFPFFTSFFQHAHNKYSLFTRVNNRKTFLSPAVGNTAPFT